MDVLFCAKYAGYYYDPDVWSRALADLVPGLRLIVWPRPHDPTAIEMVIADWAPPGLFASLPNLRCVLYPGYGPDALVASGEVPAHVTLARLEDDGIARQMAEYVVLYVLHHHRAVEAYAAQQRAGHWGLVETPTTDATTVGFMGLGRLGSAFAAALRSFGFRLAAWTRTARDSDGITMFHGEDGLRAFLGEADYVVATLPSTPATRDLMDARRFGWFKTGAVFMNLGRGDLLVAADLIAALDSGRLGGAVLDVHRPSPLPAESPLWHHPKVIVTPHSSGAKMGDAIPEVARVCRLVAAGSPPPRVIDQSRGY